MMLRADLHTHTIASGHAYSTVGEMARSAAAKGLDLIAITDHAPSMPQTCGWMHFANLHTLPREVCGVTVLRGVELNVRNMEGETDLPERVLKRLDWIIASLHEHVLPSGQETDYTPVYLALAEDPFVDMMGHPESPEYAFDMDRVLPLWAERGKVVEFNEAHIFTGSQKNRQNALRLAEACARWGVTVAVDSDAHSEWDVGCTSRAAEMLAEMGFPEELVLNLTAERVLDFLQRRARRAVCDPS